MVLFIYFPVFSSPIANGGWTSCMVPVSLRRCPSPIRAAIEGDAGWPCRRFKLEGDALAGALSLRHIELSMTVSRKGNGLARRWVKPRSEPLKAAASVPPHMEAGSRTASPALWLSDRGIAEPCLETAWRGSEERIHPVPVRLCPKRTDTRERAALSPTLRPLRRPAQRATPRCP